MIRCKVNRYLFYALAPALVSGIITSCEDDQGLQNKKAQDLRGKILTQDEFGRPVYEERGNVTVHVKGGFDERETITDGTGEFRFSQLEARPYKLTFNKPGFSPIKKWIEFSLINPEYASYDGAQNIGNVVMTKKPSVAFSNVSASVEGSGSSAEMVITGEISPTPQPGLKHGYRIFLNANPTVADTSYLYQQHCKTATIEFEKAIALSQLYSAGFEDSSDVHILIYGASSNDLSYTYNEELQFPTLSDESSQAVSTTIP